MELANIRELQPEVYSHIQLAKDEYMRPEFYELGCCIGYQLTDEVRTSRHMRNLSVSLEDIEVMKYDLAKTTPEAILTQISGCDWRYYLYPIFNLHTSGHLFAQSPGYSPNHEFMTQEVEAYISGCAEITQLYMSTYNDIMLHQKREITRRERAHLKLYMMRFAPMPAWFRQELNVKKSNARY